MSSQMDAPLPGLDPLTRWLLMDGWAESDPEQFTRHLAHRLNDVGMDIDRLRLNIRFLHPQVLGISYTYNRKNDAVELHRAAHELAEKDVYLDSPFYALYEQNAGAIRRRLDVPSDESEFPILADLRAEGFTDYAALPIEFSDGRRSALTLATKRRGGFSVDALQTTYDALFALSRIVEVFALRHTAESLLETYLGKRSGMEVLNGKVRRGDGSAISSVIWFCDLRNSTPLAEALGQDRFLRLLNGYFDCVAGAVLDNGGEILRYIGDAMLAIFPIEQENPDCPVLQASSRNAVTAARTALSRLAELNAERPADGSGPVRTGIGLHVGKVLYGNIGVPKRLEFTITGSAANEAARVESMCKPLGVPVVVSERFARLFDLGWTDLGTHELRGVGEAQTLYTLPEFDPTAP